MPDPSDREAAAVGLLDAWPWDLGGALIGARDTDEVKELFATLWCNTLQTKLPKVKHSLEADKTYHDTLSQRMFGSPKLPKNKRFWMSG